MANPYYNHGSFPTVGAPGASSPMRAEFNLITAGFDSVKAAIDALPSFVAPTFSGLVTISSLTASLPVFTDASKGLVSNTKTGTGSVVMSASPTFTGTAVFSLITATTVTAALAGNATTATLAATVTTNANLTGPITSAGNATSIAAKTGTGTTFAMQNSPVLVTPTLGVASATTILCDTYNNAANTANIIYRTNINTTTHIANEVLLITDAGLATFSAGVIVTGTAQAKTFTNSGEYDKGASGTAATINWADGQRQCITLNNHCVITLGTPLGVGVCDLRIAQNGTGNWNITWTGTGVSNARWTDATGPHQHVLTAGGESLLTGRWNGSWILTLSKVGSA